MKQLCNHRFRDFATVFRVQKLIRTFEKRAPGETKHSYRTLPQKLIKHVEKRQHTIYVLEVSEQGAEKDLILYRP